MVWLHVIHYEIIKRFARKYLGNFGQIFWICPEFYSVYQRRLPVIDKIRIVGDAVRKRPVVLKQVLLPVVCTHIPGYGIYLDFSHGYMFLSVIL